MANLAGQRADPAVFLCWQDQGRGGYSGLWHGGGRPGGQGGRAHDLTKELGGVCPAGDLLTWEPPFASFCSSSSQHIPAYEQEHLRHSFLDATLHAVSG